MFPLRDENPHPPGFKPKLTIALIIANVIVFFYEVAYTGQILEFTNGAAAKLFYEWGAVPSCLVYGALPTQFPFNCPPTSQISLVTSVFLLVEILQDMLQVLPILRQKLPPLESCLQDLLQRVLDPL